MVFYSKGKYSRKRFGKRSYRRRGGRLGLKRTYRIAKKALKLATADRGYFDQSISYDQIDEQTGFGQLYDVFFPQIGTSFSNRLGSSAKVLKVKVKGYVQMNPATDDPIPCNLIRVTLILDKACRGTPPNWFEVFNDTGVGKTVQSFRNIDYFQRFKILYDKTLQVTNGGVEQRLFRISKNINKMMSFVSNDGDTGDKSDWGIFLMFISDAPGASTSKPEVTWNSRVTFIR